jgi:hypothetical protein
MILRDLAQLPPRVLAINFVLGFIVGVPADDRFYLGMRRL